VGSKRREKAVIAGPRRLRFWRFRETRNKVVYQEEFIRGDMPVIGQVYISKDALEAWGNPSELEITLSPVGQRLTVEPAAGAG
jgi:hypothetical protein